MTLHSNILLKVEPPVSSRLWGLLKDVLKEVEKLFRVLWFIIYLLPECILQGFFSRIINGDSGGGGGTLTFRQNDQKIIQNALSKSF